MKKIKSTIKLYTKPEKDKPIGEWDFVWLASNEKIPAGYKRMKKVKRREYEKISEQADI